MVEELRWSDDRIRSACDIRIKFEFIRNKMWFMKDVLIFVFVCNHMLESEAATGTAFSFIIVCIYVVIVCQLFINISRYMNIHRQHQI